MTSLEGDVGAEEFVHAAIICSLFCLVKNII